MSTSPAQYEALHVSRVVPRRALRAPDREAKAPGALCAQLVGILHDNVSGIAGLVSRSAKTWQEALRGLRAITLWDLCELALHGRPEAKLAVYAVCSALVAAVRPAVNGSLAEAVAAYTRETSDVAPAYIRAAADGVLTRDELVALRREVLEGRLRSEALLAEIDVQETRLAS
jgi:hypothetical protein